MGTTNNQTSIIITNTLTAKVDIYEVSSASPDNPRLTYEKRGSVPAGGSQTVSPAQSTGQLQAVYSDVGAVTAAPNYYRFPLASIDYAADQTWSIGDENQKRMKDTFRFIQYTQANSDSLTAQGFLTALTAANQEAAVNKFFKSTQTFARCTWVSWLVVSAWQAQFFSVWQNTYYLYSAPADKPARLVATLVIAPAAGQDATATLQMVAPDNRSEQLQMVGDGKMQEQNPGTDAIAVTLAPAWMNVVQLNGQSFIDGAISGIINQEQVTGTRIQLPVSAPSPSSGSSDKGSSDTQSSGLSDQTKFIITAVISGVSAAAAIAGLGLAAATYYYNPNRRPAANPGGNANDPSANDPNANDPSANDPSANDPSANDPSANNPSGNAPSGNAPSGDGGRNDGGGNANGNDGSSSSSSSSGNNDGLAPRDIPAVNNLAQEALKSPVRQAVSSSYQSVSQGMQNLNAASKLDVLSQDMQAQAAIQSPSSQVEALTARIGEVQGQLASGKAIDARTAVEQIAKSVEAIRQDGAGQLLATETASLTAVSNVTDELLNNCAAADQADRARNENAEIAPGDEIPDEAFDRPIADGDPLGGGIEAGR